MILLLSGDLSYWMANLTIVLSRSPKSSMRFSSVKASYLIFVSALEEAATEVLDVHFPAQGFAVNRVRALEL